MKTIFLNKKEYSFYYIEKIFFFIKETAMCEKYVLSYDLGTSGVKASLVDFNGDLCGTEVETYPLYIPKEAWAEQEPEDYWRAVCLATKNVLKNNSIAAESIKGISFCTQWKGIIPLDEEKNVLHRSIIWLDSRAEKQAQHMNKVLQINYFKEKIAGFKPSSKLNAAMGRNIVCGADYWPKLMWLREELPEIYNKTKYILECNSYMKWRATDVMSVDMTNHFTKSFNKSSQSVYELMLNLGKVDAGLFPEITMPSDEIGYITEKAASEMGLCEGTPVFGGCGDIPAIAIGGGCSSLGDTHMYFGSSGWMASMVPCKEGFLSTSPFDKENDLLCLGSQAIGLAFDWAVDQFYNREKEEKGKSFYDFLQKELENVPAGSEGLLASHWIYGERPPFFGDDARGVFINIKGQHDRRYMLNAVMESVCYSMKLAVQALERGTKRKIEKVTAIGGGSLNDKWMQILADVLQIPVYVPQETRHCGALGAAYCALIGLGVFEDFSEAKKNIKIEKSFLPDKKNNAVYEKMFGQYKKLYPLMKDMFNKLK